MSPPFPFYEARGATQTGAARFLLVSYHFPPGTAAGALRWEKLAALAAERGWALDVITLAPDDLGVRDPARLKTLPAGTRVYGVREPKLVLDQLEHGVWVGYRLVRDVYTRRAAPVAPAIAGGTAPARAKSPRRSAARRAYNAWLEYARQRGWAQQAAAMGCQLASLQHYRAVISCGPPHMAHQGARLIADAASLPHVMDMRDPWSLVERLVGDIDSPVWYSLARRYEPSLVARAALVVMNTEPACRAMQAAYPRATGHIIAVPNGFDEEEVVLAPTAADRFTIAFAGSVYLDRDPRPLLRAAAAVVRDLHLTPADLGIEFMGEVGALDDNDPTSIGSMARAEGLAGFVHTSGVLPRAVLRERLQQAALLVSLGQDSHMAIPSKIFEYMQYPAGLVALAEPQSATAGLLKDTAADVVAPADVGTLAAVLRRRYEEFRRGHRPPPLRADRRFSRRTQAQRLFDAVERVTTPKRLAPRPPALAGSLS